MMQAVFLLEGGQKRLWEGCCVEIQVGLHSYVHGPVCVSYTRCKCR